MSTEVLQVDAQWPDDGALLRAAEVLRSGKLVAFPTETVYGLGAHALDADAVAGIFAAKGRPATNPVIVHVAGVDLAQPLVADFPEVAHQLAKAFWPGPLTLVLRKSPVVPDIVTAGGPTVAIRVPGHPVALALLETCGLPLAAPSANRSSEVSPTRGDHVLRSLEGRIDLLLDCGAVPGGLESTVLDVTQFPPRLLRPGLVSVEALEAIVGPIERGPTSREGPLPSPGMLDRHYAPRGTIELVTGSGRDRVQELVQQGLRVGWLTRGEVAAVAGATVIALPDEVAGYSAGLYAALHEFDDAQVERIIIDGPPQTVAWLAVNDRLKRASTV